MDQLEVITRLSTGKPQQSNVFTITIDDKISSRDGPVSRHISVPLSRLTARRFKPRVAYTT